MAVILREDLDGFDRGGLVAYCAQLRAGAAGGTGTVASSTTIVCVRVAQCCATKGYIVCSVDAICEVVGLTTGIAENMARLGWRRDQIGAVEQAVAAAAAAAVAVVVSWVSAERGSALVALKWGRAHQYVDPTRDVVRGDGHDSQVTEPDFGAYFPISQATQRE